jgi:hypothetical protein
MLKYVSPLLNNVLPRRAYPLTDFAKLAHTPALEPLGCETLCECLCSLCHEHANICKTSPPAEPIGDQPARAYKDNPADLAR